MSKRNELDFKDQLQRDAKKAVIELKGSLSYNKVSEYYRSNFTAITEMLNTPPHTSITIIEDILALLKFPFSTELKLLLVPINSGIKAGFLKASDFGD